MRTALRLALLTILAVLLGAWLGLGGPIGSASDTARQAAVLLSESFEDDLAASRGWYDNTRFTTTPSERRPGGGAARHAIAPTDQIHVSYWVKYSANWVGSGRRFHPHEFYLLTTEDDAWVGPAYTHLTTYIEHNYQSGGIPIVATTDGANIDVSKIGQDLTRRTENRATSGCNGDSDGIATDCYSLTGGRYNNGKQLRPPEDAPAFLADPGPGYKNDWHRVEVFLRMNSVRDGIGQLDGTVQYWLDGRLLIDHHNVLFRTGAHAAMKWNQVLLGPYIGPGSSVDQATWIDDLVIRTSAPDRPASPRPGTGRRPLE